MRSIEDKGCLKNCPTEENAGSSCMIFEFKKGSVMSRPSPHHRSSLGKPAPSKWDDAQKWLVNNLSRGDKNQPKASPRNSNADDRRLIAPVPNKWEDDDKYVVETKDVDCDHESMAHSPKAEVMRAICLRDMGTEMTPIGSKEPSRAATPIRATSPRSSSPVLTRKTGPTIPIHGAEESDSTCRDRLSRDEQETHSAKQVERETKAEDRLGMLNPLEARAAAWEEAERAKYTARYKREEVRIEAWENHEKKKAEMENRKVEVKAEQMKSRAKEKCRHRSAAIERIAQEKRAVAEAKLNENAMKNSERADYIRRNGHLPSFLSNFNYYLPSRCWYC